MIADLIIKNICESKCTNCSKTAAIIRRKTKCTYCKSRLRYNCKPCLKSYKKFNDLCQHLQVKHLSRLYPRPYKCENCDKTFILKKLFNFHKKNHCGAKSRFQCAHCNYNAAFKYNLSVHIKDKHIDTDFVCNKCGNTFTNKRSCQRHVNHCGKTEKLTCDQCDRSFNRKDNVLAHITRLHLNKTSS